MMMMALLASLNMGNPVAMPPVPTAMVPTAVPAAAAAPFSVNSDTSTSASLSSINSSDSGPYVQAKLDAGKTMSATLASRLAARKPAPLLAGGTSAETTPTKDKGTPVRSNKSPSKKKWKKESPYQSPTRAKANKEMGTRSKGK
jgi:hypothetical protein